MLKMINNTNNFDSSLTLQKSLARVDYKKPSTNANSRASSSSKNSSSLVSTANEYDKHLANLDSSRSKNLTNTVSKPLLHHGLSYQSQNAYPNANKHSLHNNSQVTNKYHLDEHFSGSDMDTMRQLEPSSLSRMHKYNDFDESKYAENRILKTTTFDDNSHSSFNNHQNKSGSGEAVAQHSSKVNKNYLLKMKKKFKRKISANVSGTKFDIGEFF